MGKSRGLKVGGMLAALLWCGLAAWNQSAAQEGPAREGTPSAAGQRESRTAGAENESAETTPAEVAEPQGQQLEDLIPILENLEKKQLFQKVSRVQNALNRDGQELLKIRARVRFIVAEAEQRIKRLSRNPDVVAVEKQFTESDLADQLVRLGEIAAPAERQKAFNALLEQHNVTGKSLEQFVDLRDARAAADLGNRQLTSIRDLLNRPAGELITIAPFQRGRSLAAQLAAIEKQLDGRPGGAIARESETPVDRIEFLIRAFSKQPAADDEPAAN